MGQYYATIIRKPNKRQAVYEANFLKLMEHSWVGNAFTNAITNMLACVTNAAQVWWCGDYTEDDEYESYKLNRESIWGDSAKRNRIPKNLCAKPNVKYLVNATKKVYIDLEEYAKASADANGDLIYPLAILTCTSNGRGGGDFYPTEDSTADLIGAWVGDQIYFSIAAPTGYDKIRAVFKEH